MTHSPLPWELGGQGDCVIAKLSPECPSLIADTVVRIGIPADQRPDEERKENSAFIVKACNLHDRLVAAVAEMLELCERCTHEDDHTAERPMRLARAVLKELESA